MSALALNPKPQVRVKLTNRWAYFDCDPDLHAEFKAVFGFRKPGVEFSQAFREGTWDGVTTLFQRGRVGAGLFLALQKELANDYALAVDDHRFDLHKNPRTSHIELRPYQREAYSAMWRAQRTGGLVLAATGAGKTRIASAFLDSVDGDGCFVCDELALLEQTRAAFSEVLGQRIGVVGKSTFDPQKITVATVQTLSRHAERPAFRKWFDSLSVMIVDEVHLALNKRQADVIRAVKPLAVFGLTATLEMRKPWVRMPAVALCGPVIYEYPIEKGVEEGYLSSGRILRVRFEDPLKGQAPGYRSEDGAWIPGWSTSAKYRYHVMLNARRNDCVVALAREAVARGRKAVVLVERKDHVKLLSRRLFAVGIKHAALSGSVKSEERIKAMKAMDAGTLDLIVASRIFAKGVDVRSISCIIDATALPGRNGAMQRYGRGTRMAEGKRGLLYVDVSDVGNPFAGASASRAKALKETGAPCSVHTWQPGGAGKIFGEQA